MRKISLFLLLLGMSLGFALTGLLGAIGGQIVVSPRVAAESQFSFSWVPAEGSNLLSVPPLSWNDEIRGIARKYTDLYGVDFALADALLEIESNYCRENVNASSSARGCFQFLDASWEALCEGNRMNYDDNIRCGIRVLSEGGIGHWCVSIPTKSKLEKIGFKC